MSLQPVPEGITIMSVDITERKRVEELLRTSEQRHRDLLASLTAGDFCAIGL